ncbi:hypothetical protein [Acidisoma sp. 7E03]
MRRHHGRADNRLLELCAQFRRVQRRLDVLWRREEACRSWATEKDAIRAETQTLVERSWALRLAVSDLPARTPFGLRAKAWMAAWETTDGDPESGRMGEIDTAASWSLARDILWRAAA